ncbi:MAG: hypothetical protein ACLFVQ_02410 [Chitinispirillaceae bacterium]
MDTVILRREKSIGFFAGVKVFRNLNESGKNLFEASVEWALEQ